MEILEQTQYLGVSYINKYKRGILDDTTMETEMNKKLHQARIDGNLKESIRVLSILDRISISDVTEQAL